MLPIAWHRMILHGIALYLVWYRIVFMLYRMVLHGIVLYLTVLHGITLLASARGLYLVRHLSTFICNILLYIDLVMMIIIMVRVSITLRSKTWRTRCPHLRKPRRLVIWSPRCQISISIIDIFQWDYPILNCLNNNVCHYDKLFQFFPQAVEFLKYNKRQFSRIYPKVIFHEDNTYHEIIITILNIIAIPTLLIVKFMLKTNTVQQGPGTRNYVGSIFFMKTCQSIKKQIWGFHLNTIQRMIEKVQAEGSQNWYFTYIGSENRFS